MENDLNNSVQDEQFGKKAEDLKEKKEDPTSINPAKPSVEAEVLAEENIQQISSETEPEFTEVPVKDEISESEAEKPKLPEKEKEKGIKKDTDKDKIDLVPILEESGEKDSKSIEEKDLKEESTAPPLQKINYSLLSNSDLVKVLSELVNGQNVNEIFREVEEIKTQFYKKLKAEIQEKQKKFIASGGLEADFSPGINEDELNLKDLLKKYRDIKFQLSQVHESEKIENLKRKFEIIEKIKGLVHNDESLNKTFNDFRDLQKDWYNIGMVPQKDLKSMWENFHYHVEKFYDYVKINKELRDLDLKKNLEAKVSLCEKAEELDLGANIVNAFHDLQKMHDQWREIGPVPKEQRTQIWDRFKEATSKINKKHHHYYQDLKDQQKKNLNSKTLLCEKVEEIAGEKGAEHISWVKKTKEILELQKVWKTIGFAPKKDNNKIYARFRSACDTFFENKRKFYSESMDNQMDNLKKKNKLCEIAEGVMNSENWKSTTDELIQLQKEWKTIGPVPRKQSDEVWKRFRSACDNFFNKKAESHSKSEANYENNLKEKEKLINEIEAFEPVDDQKSNLKKLNELQKRWTEIGFVPIKKKEEISQKYRTAINSQFDKLDLDEHKKSMLKFKNKLENLVQKPRSDIKLRFEREKMMSRLQQLKSDISVWENNIGFFANTKKADAMVSEFAKKIQSAHDNIKLLEDKISILDDKVPDL